MALTLGMTSASMAARSLASFTLVDAAEEADLCSVLLPDLPYVHTGGDFHRVHYVYPGIKPYRDELVDVAVAVEHDDLYAVLLHQVDHRVIEGHAVLNVEVSSGESSEP